MFIQMKIKRVSVLSETLAYIKWELTGSNRRSAEA